MGGCWPDASRSLPSGRPRHVVLTGTFDVRNFGDLLFPIVTQHRLWSSGIAVCTAAPTGRDTGWRDALPVASLESALLSDDLPHGVLVGGGNIIHSDPDRLPDYAAAGVADWAYPALWMGAGQVAAVRGVPLIFNAPGVPRPLRQPDAAQVFATARYAAVRDLESRSFLGAAGEGVEVVPDTVLEIAGVWPKSGLAPDFAGLVGRSKIPNAEAFVAIHVKRRSFFGAPADLARSISDFCGPRGAVPILLGLGACHGDDAVCAEICEALVIPHIDLSRPAGLREIAAAIAFARVYVGASLHGYITAASYGVSGVIVGQPRLPKVAGLLAHLDRQEDEAPDWEGGFARAAMRLGNPGRRLPESVGLRLDAHWQRVVESISNASAPALEPQVSKTARLREIVFRRGWGALLGRRVAA